MPVADLGAMLDEAGRGRARHERYCCEGRRRRLVSLYVCALIASEVSFIVCPSDERLTY